MQADLLLQGGPVWTGCADHPDADAVALQGGRVIAVDSDAAALAGPDTRVVDLAGRLALPGFIDAHVHPVQGGLGLQGCTLTELPDDEDAYLRALAAYAGTQPPGDWLRAAGWSMSAFPGGTPTRQSLDRAVPDRPVFVPNRDAHSAWVNSRALELAGIDRDTPDPPGGRIEREPDGTPSGTLHERAMELVSVLVPSADDEQRLQGLLRAQEHLHALGIVAWQDAIVGSYAGWGDPYPAYLRAVRDDLLTARVTGALWWDRNRGLEQVDELVELRAEGTTGRFRPLAVKIMQDGVAESFTAGMQEPYLDGHGHPTGNRGLSYVEPELLAEAVTLLDRRGFQVHVHAIGDRAVRETLDAFAAARVANGPSAGRHHLAHLQVVHPDDVPRFSELDLAANIQPLWPCHEPQMDELTLPFLGEPRGSWQYPFGDLLRSGTRLAAGSDWPVSSADPLHGIQVAVTRRRTDGDPTAYEPLLPDQAIGLSDALRAYTAGSAYVTHDDDAGVLRPGSRGDVVVLDRDIFSRPVDQIASAGVDLTIVDGRVVHER
ncbi:MAG TPA: amidohydrolase [Nocardioidaceae bacterium]|nr:amidohydrolase [Nocardioidaceae bacterium]